MKQGYIVGFSKPGLPKFTFEDPPYSFKWVKEFASGIASAVRKDFELPSPEDSDARQRGERMGNHLKIFTARWGLCDNDLRAITITWFRADLQNSSKYFEKL
jgi:hypothetical protein